MSASEYKSSSTVAAAAERVPTGAPGGFEIVVRQNTPHTCDCLNDLMLQ
jgi:hypothetical protein